VIRRHPDIKWLREESDINQLRQQQALMLNKVWPLLKKGGLMLYSTCSVLPEENSLQIKAFCQSHKDAHLTPVQLPFGEKQPHGWQVFPQPSGPDGFFYALVEKR
jgi:16S rRNA (cytosine967-C5)-methyltransferase